VRDTSGFRWLGTSWSLEPLCATSRPTASSGSGSRFTVILLLGLLFTTIESPYSRIGEALSQYDVPETNAS
jgi:hypothetical protein